MEPIEKINRITGDSLYQQKPEEFLLLQNQAQAGNVTAQYNVGLCHLYGQNTKVDYKEAYLWFEKAAQQGDKLAGLFLSYFNELGVGRSINYTQAINCYKSYSPSISEFDKTALWEKAKKVDEKEIENFLSEIYQKANKIGEAILKIKGFCVYYPKDNSFNFKWTDNTRSEFKQPLEEYNKLVEEFKIYLDAYTSDSDDEKYGYWIYVYEDILNLTYEICNALVGRDTLFRYLDKVGLPAIEKNKNFEFALGRCLIDDNDNTDNDYIISGLLLVAGHDEDPIWQNKVGLWYEFRNENKDLIQAEFWYKKAADLKLSAAQFNIERLKGKKEYKLITDKTEGSSEDRLKIVKSIRGNEELRNKWLLSAATLGNENATEQLGTTIDVKGDNIYNKACSFEPSWKKIELEQDDCKRKIDAWKQIVDNNRKKYIEEEKRRIKKEEEARRKAAEAAARIKAAEEEARRKAAEEGEERRRKEELAALSDDESKSKKWIWILLGLLVFGGAVWYFFIREPELIQAPDEDLDYIEELTDSIPDNYEEEVDLPSSALDFLKRFYEGSYTNEEFVNQNVTANVLSKLKRDAEKDGRPGSLAVWAFEAYTTGTDGLDVEYEEGPMIVNTNEENKFGVIYQFNYPGELKLSRGRKVYLTVTNMDGKYLISDYEVDNSELGKAQENEMSSEGNEIQTTSTEEDVQITATSTQDKQSYVAWFFYGTLNELNQFGVINENQELCKNFDKSCFTKIDIRTDKEIKLYSKKAKILTSHPASAYTLKPNERKQYVLRIIDPQLFWSSGQYLVVLVE